MSKDSSSKKQNETLDQRMNLPMLMALHGFTGRGFPKEVTGRGKGAQGIGGSRIPPALAGTDDQALGRKKPA
jgi:hypothetical protein